MKKEYLAYKNNFARNIKFDHAKAAGKIRELRNAFSLWSLNNLVYFSFKMFIFQTVACFRYQASQLNQSCKLCGFTSTPLSMMRLFGTRTERCRYIRFIEALGFSVVKWMVNFKTEITNQLFSAGWISGRHNGSPHRLFGSERRWDCLLRTQVLQEVPSCKKDSQRTMSEITKWVYSHNYDYF